MIESTFLTALWSGVCSWYGMVVNTTLTYMMLPYVALLHIYVSQCSNPRYRTEICVTVWQLDNEHIAALSLLRPLIRQEQCPCATTAAPDIRSLGVTVCANPRIVTALLGCAQFLQDSLLLNEH